MTEKLTGRPGLVPQTFVDFPYTDDLDDLHADIAILGIPFGMPYQAAAMANDQSRAPDAIRQASLDIDYTLNHYDWDLGGPLLDDRDVRVVDCGNVSADMSDHKLHYQRAEAAARKILGAGTTLITLGGDHGISIPIMRALEDHGPSITLVHVDAHLDWRDEINGEKEGYSSPIRRASEMPWFDKIVQIGLRGIDAVLERIPNGGPYYLTIDADGIDPTIMPGVMSQTPGGLDWIQTHKLLHGLVKKGRVLGMDLVEIAPKHDVGNITLIHAERLICNFIGAAVRAGYYE
jgi:agmatinase